MKSHTLFAGFDKSKWGPIEIAAEYFLLGVLWILFSDKAAAKLASNTEALSQISIYKGWGYVLVTAVLLYWLISRHATKVREANERYRFLAENSSDVIWLLDPMKGKFKYISPSVLKLRGYTAEEAMSQPLNEAFVPEDIERLTALTLERITMFQAKGSGTLSFIDEMRQPHRDGSIVPTEVTTSYLFNGKNEIEILGVTRDITKRRRAEKKLQESEKQYQELLDQASDGILIADAQGQYTLVNEEACRLVGYTKEELLSMNIRDLVAPEDLEATPLRLDELRSGKKLITERKLLRKDESRIVCEVSAKILSNGRYQSIIRDITERKVTEEALIRSEKRYRSLFENMSNGYARCQMLYDENGKPIDFIYLDVNNAFRKLTGLQDVIGRRVSEVIPGIYESNSELMKIYGGVAATGQSEQFETYVPGLGTGTWLSVSAYSSEKGFFVTVFEIITERKRAEQALRDSQARLVSIIDTAMDAIVTLDADQHIILFNPAAERMFRCPAARMLGQTLDRLIPERFREGHHEHIHEFGRTNQTSRKMDALNSLTCLRIDGEEFPAEITISQAEMNGQKIYTAIVRDITTRKQTEEALRQSEQKFSILFEKSAFAASLSMLSDGVIVEVNESFERVFGYTRQEVIGKTSLELGINPDSDGRARVLAALKESNSARNLELALQTRSGETRIFSINVDIVAIEGQNYILNTARDITERKQAETILRDNEERLRLSLHAANQGLYDLNVQTGDATVNREYVEMLGYDFDTFVETNAAWIERLHPDDQEITAKAYSDYVQGLRPEYRVEFRQRTKQGSWKWILSLGRVVEFDAEGKPLRMLGTHTDITERKRAEEALRLSQENFARAFNTNPAALAITRVDDGEFLIINEAYTNIMGYEPDEILGRTVASLSIYVNPGERNHMILQLQEQGRVRNYELLVRSKSGETRNLLVSMEPILYDNDPCILSTFLDITERKQMEQEIYKLNAELEQRVVERTAELSQANTLLQAMMDNIPDHIYFKDRQSRFIRNSRAQANLMGLRDPAEVVGRSDFDFFPHAQRAFDEEQEMMKSGQSFLDIEEYVVWPDGRDMWVSTKKVPLRNQDGQVIGLFGISRDITERKHAEEKLQKAKTELEVANKELESFSYSVSHDLRAPLRAINGYANILVEDYGSLLDEEGMRVCSVISRETQRMGKLIDDLLAFSRLGRKEMRLTRIDMQSLVESVLNDLLRDEDKSRLDIQVGLLHPTEGDSALIRQVWVNLLSNAIKFTSKKKRAVIEVQSSQDDGEVIYSVRDNGAGFDMEYANKLFGVFQRLHGESEFEGTGVGLAIVQRVIRRHDGRVWAEGKVDEGAVFHFALPRRQE